MKVINPDLGVYLFEFIPRRYDIENLSFEIVNELRNSVITQNITYNQTNKGYLSFLFDASVLENNSHYTIKILSDDEVVYRGKIYTTNETDLQNYSLLTVNENIIDL